MINKWLWLRFLCFIRKKKELQSISIEIEYMYAVGELHHGRDTHTLSACTYEKAIIRVLCTHTVYETLWKLFTTSRHKYISQYTRSARYSSAAGSSSQARNKYESRESLIMQIGRIQWGIVFGRERGSTIRGRTAGQPCDLWGSAQHDNWIRLASAECKMGFLFSLQSRTGEYNGEMYFKMADESFRFLF